MTIEQALAWADQTMNERLREARRTGNDHDYDAAMEGCIDILAAEVRRLRQENAELRADGIDSPHSNMPVKYYNEGGMTYAVYGSSSINYVEFLRQRHAELEADVLRLSAESNGRQFRLQQDEAKLLKLRARLATAEAERDKLQNKQFCAYCGWSKESSSWDDLRRHVETCEAHPLVAVIRERDTARAEAETERLRLAACGVAALGNTEAMVAERLTPEHPYYSASYRDVCSAVDREMAHRAEAERERIENAHLREAFVTMERAYNEREHENARLLEAIRLEGEDADFYFISDHECRLYANLNDTFGYAVADAEPIPWDEFDAVITAWKADPVSLLVWAAQKRGYDLTALVGDAGVPPSTRDALRAWARREP